MRIHNTTLRERCHPAGAGGVVQGLDAFSYDFLQLLVGFEVEEVVKEGVCVCVDEVRS
jgi:hypothetical protein